MRRLRQFANAKYEYAVMTSDRLKELMAELTRRLIIARIELAAARKDVERLDRLGRTWTRRETELMH